MHNPKTGRFFTIDPLAESYYYNSPYAFAENKLGRGIELEGLELGPYPLLTPKPTGALPRTLTRIGRTLSKVELHHLIPKALRRMKAVRDARRGGFKFEGKENKMPLEKFSKETGKGRHGNHPKYTAEVQRRITEFQEKMGENIKPENAAKFAKELTKDLKDFIKNNPDTKINDLFKQLNGVVEVDGTSQQGSPEQEAEKKMMNQDKKTIYKALENLQKMREDLLNQNKEKDS